MASSIASSSIDPGVLLIVTGLPASGKSTLATRLAASLRWPLFAKDTVKEALFDTLGTGDAHWSRRLSDASFATLFALARGVLRDGGSVLLEGNFRPGEHEARIVACRPRLIVQVLCAIPEEQRHARLRRRARSRARHPGHRDASAASGPPPAPAAFLDLPGPRLDYDGARSARGDLEPLLTRLASLLGRPEG